MHFQTTSLLALLLSTSPSLTSAATITIEVGKSGLTYSPNTTTAAMGDEIQFIFYPADHNVVQANFTDPCTPLDDGFYSGFHSTSSGPANQTFTVMVNNTDPIWFYCGQAKHCQSGMVGVINPPSTGNDTLEGFAKSAADVTKSMNPTKVQGGVLAAFSSTSTSMNSSSSSSAASSSAAMMSASASATSTAKTGAAANMRTPAFAGLVAAVGVVALAF